MNSANRNVGHRSFRTLLKSFVAIGATSALMLAGLAFVAVSPASALAPLIFGGTATAQAGTTFGFTVTAAASGDNINVASTCPFTTGVTSEVTNGSDVAIFTGMSINVGSSCTLTATDTTGADNGAQGTEVFTVTPANAFKLIFTTAPPANATLGVALTTFKVSVEDTYGNVVTAGTGNNDSIVISSSCTLTGTLTQNAVLGVATFTGIAVTVGTSCTLTATDSTGGDTGFTVANAAVNVATTTASKVGFTPEPSATATAGTVLPSFAVSVEESNGVPIPIAGTGATDVIVISSTCALTGTTTETAVGGVATFPAVIIKTGAACTLVATDVTRTLATASSTAITLLAGAATQIVFTTAPPTSVAAASTVLTTFKASVEDVNNNVVTTGTGATDTIAITSPCTLGGITTAVAVAGVATFSALTVNVTGACVLTATDSARTLTAGTATTTVGTPQAVLVLTTVKGTVGKALNLATTGGTGTGALSYSVAAGSSAGCTVSGTSLSAKRAGTCLVTATKAGSTTYISVSSAATRVTFILPFKVTRVAGAIYAGRTQTVTLVGSGFSGRPRIISNARGLSARVTRDTGRTLRVLVTVSPAAKSGVHVMAVILSNGKRASVRFSLR
jgi:hypothetical protein